MDATQKSLMAGTPEASILKPIAAVQQKKKAVAMPRTAPKTRETTPGLCPAAFLMALTMSLMIMPTTKTTTKVAINPMPIQAALATAVAMTRAKVNGPVAGMALMIRSSKVGKIPDGIMHEE